MSKKGLKENTVKKKSFLDGNKPTVAAFIILFVVIVVLVVALVYKHNQNTASYYSQSEIDKYVKELGDYKNLTLEDMSADVSKEDVQAEIDSVIAANTKSEDILKGTAKKGDTVKIDFVGKIDGKEFDGGSAVDRELELGSGAFIEGFEDAVIGMKVGDKKDIKLKFPKDYYSADVAGKDVVFTTTLKALVKKNTPKLTDDFVKQVSKKSKTVSEYKKEIEENLKQEKIKSNESTQKYTLLSNVVSSTVMKKDKNGKDKYPKKDLDELVNAQLESYQTYADAQGVSLDEYISQQTGSDLKSFKSQLRESAKASLKQNLVVSAIGRAEGIKVSANDVKDFVKEYLEDINMTEEDFKAANNGMSLEDSVGEAALYSYVLSDKVQDTLYSMAEKNTVKKKQEKSGDTKDKSKDDSKDKKVKDSKNTSNEAADAVAGAVSESAEAVAEASEKATKEATKEAKKQADDK